MCEFRVGQKVCCVDAQDSIVLSIGQVYEIDGIQIGPNWPMVHLVGHGESCLWFARRFRPVVERKTSIAIFHEILKTQHVRTDA